MSKTKRLLRKLTPEVRTPIGTEIYLPNHSGANNHPHISPLVANHPHQDVNTTASPEFVKVTATTGTATEEVSIEHDGTDAVIEAGTGKLLVKSNPSGDNVAYQVQKGADIANGHYQVFLTSSNSYIQLNGIATLQVISAGGKKYAYFGSNANGSYLGANSRPVAVAMTPVDDYTFAIQNQATTRVALMIKGIASQTADTVQIQNSSGTILKTIDKDGNEFWSEDGTGLPYGSCYGNHIGWSQANAVQNTWYNISDADMNDGELNEVTHDGSGKLTVGKAGRYLINYTICMENTVSNDHIEVGIEVSGSGSANDAGQAHIEINTANEEVHLSGTCILDLATSATVEVAIRTTDNNTPDLSVQGLNITVLHVGGT